MTSGPHQVCPKGLPPRHSFRSPSRGTPISGGRIQKRPLTHPGRALADSASSLLRLTGKGLTPRSSLSFSRSVFLSTDTRRLSAFGGSVLPPPGSRRQRALPEPVELFTRLVTIKRDCGPWSRRGISRAPVGHGAPALNQTALPAYTAKSFPLARIRGRRSREGSFNRRGTRINADAGQKPGYSTRIDAPRRCQGEAPQPATMR